jgi:hypothetical protein
MSVDRPGTNPAATTTPATPGIDLTDRADERESIGELLSATAHDIGELFRKEVELAKTEIREEAAATARAGGMIAVGGLVAYLALLLVLLAAAWGLAEAIPLWLSLLIVGVVAGAVGAVLVITGKDRLASIQAAPTTIETLQEDVQWARQQLS